MTVGGREDDSNVELLVPVVMTNELSRKEETVMCWNRSINYVKVDLCKRVFCN